MVPNLLFSGQVGNHTFYNHLNSNPLQKDRFLTYLFTWRLISCTADL